MRYVRHAVAAMVAVLVMAGFARAAEPSSPARPFHGDIDKLTKQSSDYRRVLFTGAHTQVVAMSLAAGEDIGDEVHRADQCFFVVEGKGQSAVSGQTSALAANEVLCVPAGVRHNIRNAGSNPLKLYTIYSPPQHPAGTVHHTKQEAQRAEVHPSR